MSNFSEREINEKVDKILKEKNIKILYNMSTSGSFVVKQCVDATNDNFILKIRKKDNSDLQRKFINEICINRFLSEIDFNKFPYEISSYDTKEAPEFFLYKMVEGWALNGYYFLIGSRQKENYKPEEVADLLLSLQNASNNFLNYSDEINLVKKGHLENINYFVSFNKYYIENFGQEDYFLAKKLVESSRKYFEEKLVLCHGDLNPKNILKTKKESTAFIDWTEICLNNPLYDAVCLYLSSWNAKDLQKKLKADTLEKIDSNEYLFNLNVLILTGKFLEVLDNSSEGINKDFEKGFIGLETKEKMLDKHDQAKQAIKDRFKKSLNYLKD